MTEDKIIDLVQLTDPHLFADPEGTLYGLKTKQTLDAVVADIRANRATDLVIATGDLVHDETEAGYASLRESLEPLAVPTHLIPGNHDDLGIIQHQFSDGMISCNKLVRTVHWQIILLNSQVPGKVGGRLDDKELRWLEQCLSNTSIENTIIFLHHHPVSIGTKWLEPLGLDNADKLFELIAAAPQVRAVVWGHVHQEFDEMRAGVRLLATPSTCIQFKPNVAEFELDYLAPGYRWFKLYPDGQIETGVKRLSKVPEGLDPDGAGY